jgi:hypothetical protein
MQKGQIIFWGLVTAIVAGGSYAIYKKLKKDNPLGTGGDSSEQVINDTTKASKDGIGSGESTNKSKTASTPFPLKLRSVGRGVVALQAWLNWKGARVDVDGRFGGETSNALKKYFPVKCALPATCEITLAEFNKLDGIKSDSYKKFARKNYASVMQRYS